MDNQPEHRTNAGAGGKYHEGVGKTDESADKRDEWGREDTEKLASEEEAEMGAGEAGRPLTTTVGEPEESGVYGIPGSAAAVKATSATADKARAVGGHGAKTSARDSVAVLEGKPGRQVLWSGRRRGGLQGQWSDER